MTKPPGTALLVPRTHNGAVLAQILYKTTIWLPFTPACPFTCLPPLPSALHFLPFTLHPFSPIPVSFFSSLHFFLSLTLPSTRYPFHRPFTSCRSPFTPSLLHPFPSIPVSLSASPSSLHPFHFPLPVTFSTTPSLPFTPPTYCIILFLLPFRSVIPLVRLPSLPLLSTIHLIPFAGHFFFIHIPLPLPI